MLRLITLLSLALLSSNVSGEEKLKTVKIAIGDYPPFTLCGRKEAGEIPANMATEIVVSALKSQGVDAEISCYPWGRAERLVATGEYDITFPYVSSEEREKTLSFIPMPLKTETVLFHLVTRPRITISEEGMSPYRFGASLGYYYGELFDRLDKAGKVDWVTTDEQNFRKLLRGRIDYFPLSFHVGYYVLSQFPRAHSMMITSSPDPLMVKHFNVMYGKDSPKEDQLREVLGKGFEEINASGRLEAIRENYLSPGN